jgi:hypothetical protein
VATEHLKCNLTLIVPNFHSVILKVEVFFSVFLLSTIFLYTFAFKHSKIICTIYVNHIPDNQDL